MKRPAFQFYPADWRKDVELQSCSMAAQGLWINIMCLAHECDPYGFLTVNGKAMTAAQLGRQVGLSAKEADALLEELIDAGVARRNEDGAIYSKRMVNDERVRNARASGGSAGAEHGIKGKDFGSRGGRGGEFDGPGLLYAAQRVSGGAIKVGVTKHLKQRISALRGKTGEEITVLGVAQVPNMQAAEQYLLEAFEGRRDGEWISAEWGAVRAALQGSPHPPFQPPPSSSSSTSVNSVPDGTGGKPPPKPAAEQSKTELWRSAVSLLAEQHMPEPQARSFIGKLTKDYPDGDIVLDAVRAAVSEQPADARAYLKATCQRLAGERRRDGVADWTRAAV